MVAQRLVIYLVAWQGLKLHKHGLNTRWPHWVTIAQKYIIQIEVRATRAPEARTQLSALNNSTVWNFSVGKSEFSWGTERASCVLRHFMCVLGVMCVCTLYPHKFAIRRVLRCWNIRAVLLLCSYNKLTGSCKIQTEAYWGHTFEILYIQTLLVITKLKLGLLR